jgi:hypothetical protein
MNLELGASDASTKRLQRLGSAARPRPLNHGGCALCGGLDSRTIHRYDIRSMRALSMEDAWLQ